MNQPILQALNQLLGPVQLALILVYVRGGELIWGAGPSQFTLAEMLRIFREASLGEFFALAASLEHLAIVMKHAKAKVLADTLDAANGRFLEQDKSPGRKLGTTDNRGSHFYLALYWAQALAAQDADADLKRVFAPVAAALASSEANIAQELIAAQGRPADVGGYYQPDDAKASAAMRPSATLNAILAGL